MGLLSMKVVLEVAFQGGVVMLGVIVDVNYDTP
jgi:hypothetical protein